MYRVQFTDFRAFGLGEKVEIKPITLVVGENSAGKTSFLAGLRFMLESLSVQAPNPFNRDPYFLGGFDQIAHFTGGRRGRAKEFSMSIFLDDPSEGRPRGPVAPRDIAHHFTFTRGAPQPELHSYRFEAAGTQLNISADANQPHVRITQPGGKGNGTSVPFEGAPPSKLLRENTTYIPFFIHDMEFRLNRRNHERSSEKDSAGTVDDTINPKDVSVLVSTFRKYAKLLSQDVFSSAPVRTQPLRTYTPSELLASSEGSHVPLELSRMKRSDPERWDEIRLGLIQFGQNSGLFNDLDIRQLGKGDIDPFQIMVKINGPAINLADVGYGISQILPIIYQVQHANRHQTYLLQQPEVHLHPRAQAELGSLFVKVAAASGIAPTFVIETHSDYILDRIRIEVAAGKISPKDVTIIFFQKGDHGSTAMNLHVNELGEIYDAPPEYRAFFMEEHGRLIGF